MSEKLVVHIPARAGSKRVRAKNLRYINGAPLISYAIRTAIASESFDRVFVNSDSAEILQLAESLGVETFQRDVKLANDEATGDDFTINIIEAIGCGFLAMINPVCPLLEPATVRSAVDTFWEKRPDTLISCSETQMQTAVEGSFVNIDPGGPLRPTQENPSVQILNWAITIWDATRFRENYANGSGAYCGSDRLLFPIPALEGVKISEEEDFELAESLMRAQNFQGDTLGPVYWSSDDV